MIDYFKLAVRNIAILYTYFVIATPTALWFNKWQFIFEIPSDFIKDIKPT